ncbi:putative translation initiation factor eIF-2B subunit epsilon [Diplonema papillatum]|nr:putative translation initiation factor eIF-2B subunit epsilon [Diplonema papillatum]|eukprot:gene6621-10132_t
MSKKVGKEKEMPQQISAVVVADSFTEDFRPVTYEMPRTLLPVAGVVLMDYTIEFLVSNGIDEIFVLACAHARAIEEHVKQGKWGKSQEVNVRVIVSTTAVCLADALREVHAMDLLRQDFVLITGDIVANIANLKQIFQKHEMKRKADSSILMTLILKEQTIPMLEARDEIMKTSARNARNAEPQRNKDSNDDLVRLETEDDGTRKEAPVPEAPAARRQRLTKLLSVLGEERVTAVMDPVTCNLLQYNAWAGDLEPDSDDDDDEVTMGTDGVRRKGSEKVGLDLKLFSTLPTLQVRTDLIETGMAICSVALLVLFEQNFDFRNMRDCIKSVINEELLGNKIVCELIPSNAFVRRVRNVEQYAVVSRAVVEGWTHPLVVDSNFARSDYHGVASREPSVYIDATASLSRTCTTGHSTLLGRKVVVSDGCSISHSVIASQVEIGPSTEIRHSHVWSDVTIGSGCKIHGAVICDKAVIGDNCVINPQCVISFGVKIAPNTVVQPGMRITRVKLDDFGSAFEPMQYVTEAESDAVVGAGGVGKLWEADVEAGAALDLHKMSLPQDDDASSTDSIFVDDDDNDTSNAPAGSHDERFAREVLATVRRALEQNLDCDGVLLEVNGLKFGFDASIVDCCRACLLGLLYYADESDKPFLKFFKALKQYHQLVSRFHSEQIEKEILNTVVDFSKLSAGVLKELGKVLHALYDKSLLSEDSVLEWEKVKLAEKANGTLAPAEAAALERAGDFLSFLKESDESEESEESD